MSRIASYQEQKAAQEYSFIVVFEPLKEISATRKNGKEESLVSRLSGHGSTFAGSDHLWPQALRGARNGA
jgi:hypothetical protein